MNSFNVHPKLFNLGLTFLQTQLD
jgi:hypothetical protein